MPTRMTITLGVLIALGFLGVIALRAVGDNRELPALQSAAPASSSPSDAEHRISRATPRSAPASSAAAHTQEVSAPDHSLGRAAGNIHFERAAAAPGTTSARIDLNVKSALGIWQPGESRMQILLFDDEPKADEVTQLLRAAQSGMLGPAVRGRSALLELRFIGNAQAFDRNELDSARLIVNDGALSSSADALSGLDWAGSLPSPQLVLPPDGAHPTVELTSGGDTATVDGATWKQTWRFTLTVPVITRR